MKNDYEIRGDVTVIFLDRKDGTRLECLIDTADLPRAMEFPNTWFAWQQKSRKAIYVRGNPNVYLHRWLLNPPKYLQVDHVDPKNTLDNRRSNLRVVTCAENAQNRFGAYKTNKSCGIRGITFDKNRNKWQAKLTLNYKTIHIGRFSSIVEAENALIKARCLLMPFSYYDKKRMEA